MAAFDGPLKAPEGLPAFQAESRSGRIIQGARGCGNSGILLFASELDPAIAGRWYEAYEKNFWKDTGWIAGFTEMPLQSRDELMDVDSGPVLCRIGSVSSAFGIGAAKAVGRIDHAAPADDAGCRLFVADALWLSASRADGPLGGQELESGRGSAAVFDDQAHAGGRDTFRLKATHRPSYGFSLSAIPVWVCSSSGSRFGVAVA